MEKYDPVTVARFWSKVDVRKNPDECWEWRGAKRHYGYGGLKVRGKVMRSNRIAWEIANGEDIGGRHALHTCDNPACCNPRHIYAGDRYRNMRDIQARGRRHTDKLSHDVAHQIRSLRAAGASARALAADFNVHTSTIYRVCKGSRWTL